MTRRECVIVLVMAVAMIAAGLTMLYGPWGLIGTGAAVVIGVLVLVNEREEDKPNA